MVYAWFYMHIDVTVSFLPYAVRHFAFFASAVHLPLIPQCTLLQLVPAAHPCYSSLQLCYLLMNTVTSRSVSGSFQLSLA